MEAARRSRLKSGRGPSRLSTRKYKAGETLFTEGSRGRELFIIQQGCVGIYKRTENGEIQLATIGEKGIIGEMSLLDNLPRSASVIARQPTVVTVINENVFSTALQTAPVWLTSIVKIVVSRLRDANRRVTHCSLRNKRKGVLSLIKLLLSESGHVVGERQDLRYDYVVVEVFHVCRISKKETERILEEFENRGLIRIERDEKKVCYIRVRDSEAVDLYLEYLSLRDQGKNFSEVSLPEYAVGVLSNIAYLAQKSGQKIEDGIALPKQVLLDDLGERNPEKLERCLFDLKRLGVIRLTSDNSNAPIIFDPQLAGRFKKIREWLPRFETETT